MDKSADYEVIIRPEKGWFCFDWKEFFHYRDLLFLLVRRDFVAKYKQTFLGPVWFFIQPLLSTVVFTVIFKNALKISTGEIPSILFYLEGLLFWNYFSQSFTGVAMSMTANSGILTQVYFPRLILPLSAVISNLLTAGIQFLTLIVFYVYFKFFTQAGSTFHVTGHIVFLPWLILQTAMTAFGFGLWIAALTGKRRDLLHAVGFFTQLWMYATPIIYPASLLVGNWRMLLTFNPMAQIIELSRVAFFGAGEIQIHDFLLSILITAVVCLSAILFFNKAEQDFVDFV